MREICFIAILLLGITISIGFAANKPTTVHTKARLWMAKSYIQTQEYLHAEIELKKIINDFYDSRESLLAEKLLKQYEEQYKLEY